jgi:hypothetical protein
MARTAQLARAAIGATLLAAPAAPALAHGGVTGVQDILQDYGALAFLLAVVLIGAGVLTWVVLAPQPDWLEGNEPPAPGADQPAPHVPPASSRS